MRSRALEGALDCTRVDVCVHRCAQVRKGAWVLMRSSAALPQLHSSPCPSTLELTSLLWSVLILRIIIGLIIELRI